MEEADRLCELPDASKAKLARLSALMEYNSKLVCPSLRQGQQDRHAEVHLAPTRAVIDTAHDKGVNESYVIRVASRSLRGCIGTLQL